MLRLITVAPTHSLTHNVLLANVLVLHLEIPQCMLLPSWFFIPIHTRQPWFSKGPMLGLVSRRIGFLLQHVGLIHILMCAVKLTPLTSSDEEQLIALDALIIFICSVQTRC